jgi:lipopolysaccharide exporter
MSAGEGNEGDSVVSSVRWSAVTVFGRQGGVLVTAFVLARLLGPTRYGVVTQAGIYLALVNLLLDQGLSFALIRSERVDAILAWSVVWMNICSAAIICVVVWFIAPTIQEFFRTDDLANILRALTPVVLAQAAVVVPEALMTRAMQFRRLALVDLCSIMAGGVTGVGIVLAGGGIWCAVAAPFVASATALVGFSLCFERPLSIRGLSIRRVRDMRKFAVNLLGYQGLNFASRNADNLVVARVLGPAALANYALSYRTMMLGVQSITMLVNRVMFPVYSRLQHDLPRLRDQFLSTTQLVSLITFPAMALVVVLAPTAVVLGFGDAWSSAVAPMQILAVTGMRQSVGALAGPIFMASGRTDWLFRWQIVSAAFFVGSFIIGVRWGITGVATAYSLTGLILQVPESWLVGRILNLRLVDYGRLMVPALVGALAAGTAAAAIALPALEAGMPKVVVLIAAFVGGIGADVVILRIIWPEISERAIRAGLALLGVSRPAPAAAPA